MFRNNATNAIVTLSKFILKFQTQELSLPFLLNKTKLKNLQKEYASYSCKPPFTIYNSLNDQLQGGPIVISANALYATS